MSKVIMVSSFKGGVGKTTLTAALAVQLAARGKKTVAVDMDFGTRGLDIALGAENLVSGNVLELLRGTATPEEAAVQTNRENLCFVPAPSAFSVSDLEGIDGSRFDEALSALAENNDIVLLDMPAGNSFFYEMLRGSKAVNYALVVTTDNVNAVRAAEKTASELSMRGIGNIRLLINSYDLSDPDRNNGSIVTIIKKTSVPVIGVVPYSPAAERATADSKTLSDIKKDAAGIACGNIAGRICGERIALLHEVVKPKKRLRFY